MKRFTIGVGSAWIGIVALAWWLAEQRMKFCWQSYGWDHECFMRATATRDATLIWGAGIGLAAFTVGYLALGGARVRRPANQAERAKPARSASLLP